MIHPRAQSPEGAPERQQHRRWLALGSTLTVAGLILSCAHQPDFGAWAATAGLLLMLLSIHKLGRDGSS